MTIVLNFDRINYVAGLEEFDARGAIVEGREISETEMLNEEVDAMDLSPHAPAPVLDRCSCGKQNCSCGGSCNCPSCAARNNVAQPAGYAHRDEHYYEPEDELSLMSLYGEALKKEIDAEEVREYDKYYKATQARQGRRGISMGFSGPGFM